MTLKTTHAAGEPIKADDMNSTVKAVLQNAHNIFELFLENFFASKITPFLGLFFDGFSDTTKADTTATTLTAGASSGQAILTVASTTGFKVGHNINIFDGTNLDEKVIQSIDSAVQITLTTNFEQLRHMCDICCDETYVGENQEVMIKILKILKQEAPVFFHDFTISEDGKSATRKGSKYSRNKQVNWTLSSQDRIKFGLEEKTNVEKKE